MSYQDILVEIRGHAICVTLNRPERMNAISVATGEEMLQVFEEYRDNPELRAMIIAAAATRLSAAECT